MKKLALFFAMMLTALVATAQDPVLTLKGGIGIANWMGGDVENTDVKFAYKFGVGVEFPISQVWSFQTGMNFVAKGAKADDNVLDGDNVDLTCNQLYLELPIMAAARVAVDDRTNLVFSAGPYLGYGVGGNVKAEAKAPGTSASVEVDTFGDDGAGLRRFDWGLGFGVAAEFGHLVVGVDGQVGLNNLIQDVSAKNLSAFLTVGYKF